MPDILVAYYSFEGHTRAMAQAIAQAVGADLLVLRPVEEPPAAGLGKYLWGGTRVVMRRTPLLEPLERDPAHYGTLFIGTPVWAFSYTPPLRTFLAEHDFTGKRVALFASHDGALGKTFVHMRKALAKATILGEKDWVRYRTTQEQIVEETAAWARELVGPAGAA